MSALIARYKKQYDMLIIDTPPVLHMPDARLLGRMSDAVVLVLRAGRTCRDAAQAARLRLSEDRTRVLGVILNDWNPKTSANSFYGHYDANYYKRYYEPRSDIS